MFCDLVNLGIAVIVTTPVLHSGNFEILYSMSNLLKVKQTNDLDLSIMHYSRTKLFIFQYKVKYLCSLSKNAQQLPTKTRTKTTRVDINEHIL